MFSNPKGRAAALILALTIVAGACGDSSKSLEGTVVKDGLGCTVESVERAAAAPAVKPAEKVEKVTTKDLKKAGKGACKVEDWPYLTLDMVGAKASDGTVFVDTFGKDRPVTAQLGLGKLLVGLEEGLKGLAVGGRRQIDIPAAKAYGADGNPAQGIGPDENLTFVVDLVATGLEPQYCNEPQPLPAGRPDKPTTVVIPLKPWTEMKTTDITVGDGEEAKRDSLVEVEYLGVGCFSGVQFDSSWDREEPIKAALEDAPQVPEYSSVIPGWTDGIVGMKEGGVRQIDIPAELAYGSQGGGTDIAPNEPLVFVVKLVRVKFAPEESAIPSTTAAGDDATTTTAEGATTTTAAQTSTTEG